MTDTAHVVIVGAGFAGLSAVGKLRKSGLRVTVIDKNLYNTFQPLLYQVATGGLNPGDVAYPVGGFTTRRDARYIRGDLVAIDPSARVVRLAGGREIGYDYLILATGVSANYFGVKGAADNTFGLYTRVDAIVLRDHIMNGFEWLSADPDGRREFAVTVVGGGATGVELAGTLGELRGDVLRVTFPDVDPQRMHIRLVETAPELLMPFNPKLRAYTRRQLEKRGIDIRVNTTICEVTADRVLFADGTWHRSDLTVWTGGVAAADSVGSWGLPQGKSGRLLVGPDLRVEGTDRIFATGDIALNQETPSPQLAQPALQEGRHAAEQIVHLVRGEPTQPFHYHDKGTMATIGRRSAVVELAHGARITGTLAWFAWLGLHLFYLVGYRNRIATLINLSWRYIAWGHGGGVIVGDEPTEPVRKDDVTGAAQAAGNQIAGKDSAAEKPAENAEKEPAETKPRETQPSEHGGGRAEQASGERAR
jgi:NADH dehydrogenase